MLCCSFADVERSINRKARPQIPKYEWSASKKTKQGNAKTPFTRCRFRNGTKFLRLKAHTHRTRFGNAARFFGFEKSTNLLFAKFYWKVYNISTARVVYFSYLPKFSIVDRFICFWKMKNRAALPNLVRCVSAFRPVLYVKFPSRRMRFKQQIMGKLIYLSFELHSMRRIFYV